MYRMTYLHISKGKFCNMYTYLLECVTQGVLQNFLLRESNTPHLSGIVKYITATFTKLRFVVTFKPIGLGGVE